MINNEIISKQNHDILTISFSHQFNFEVHQQFRAAYHGKLQNINNLIVDLESVVVMDSSALGMLMVLFKYAQQTGNQITITLVNPRPQVRSLLRTARFHEIFTIT